MGSWEIFSPAWVPKAALHIFLVAPTVKYGVDTAAYYAKKGVEQVSPGTAEYLPLDEVPSPDYGPLQSIYRCCTGQTDTDNPDSQPEGPSSTSPDAGFPGQGC